MCKKGLRITCPNILSPPANIELFNLDTFIYFVTLGIEINSAYLNKTSRKYYTWNGNSEIPDCYIVVCNIKPHFFGSSMLQSKNKRIQPERSSLSYGS